MCNVGPPSYKMVYNNPQLLELCYLAIFRGPRIVGNFCFGMSKRQGPEWEDKMNANGGHFQAIPSDPGPQ